MFSIENVLCPRNHLKDCNNLRIEKEPLKAKEKEMWQR